MAAWASAIAVGNGFAPPTSWSARSNRRARGEFFLSMHGTGPGCARPVPFTLLDGTCGPAGKPAPGLHGLHATEGAGGRQPVQARARDHRRADDRDLRPDLVRVPRTR